MTAIDRIDHDPDEWWGFSSENGWVVLDRKDERNLAGELLTFVRSSDCPNSSVPAAGGRPATWSSSERTSSHWRERLKPWPSRNSW